IAAVGIGEDVVQTRSPRDHGRRAAGEDTGKKRRNWRHALDRQHDDQQRRDSSHGEIRKLACSAEVMASRSEEHTSELQSLMRISYAVFCLNKKRNTSET